MTTQNKIKNISQITSLSIQNPTVASSYILNGMQTFTGIKGFLLPGACLPLVIVQPYSQGGSSLNFPVVSCTCQVHICLRACSFLFQDSLQCCAPHDTRGVSVGIPHSQRRLSRPAIGYSHAHPCHSVPSAPQLALIFFKLSALRKCCYFSTTYHLSTKCKICWARDFIALIYSGEIIAWNVGYSK